jgi:hypothetical protein
MHYHQLYSYRQSFSVEMPKKTAKWKQLAQLKIAKNVCEVFELSLNQGDQMSLLKHQKNIFVQINTFIQWKKWPKDWAVNVCNFQKNCPKVNTGPIGENSPN